MSSQEPKNVVLLSLDALRADHLSFYGYERGTSPNIDSVAMESLVFENAYSASSHTREAVPALLTGMFPDVAVDGSYHLSRETIASKLADEGFVTGGFHSNPFISRAYGFGDGFDRFDDDLHLGQHKLIALAQRALDKLRNRHYARADEINERSLAWVDSLEPDQPFFLWNHYMDTHGPYEPPGKYRDVFGQGGVSDRRAQSLYRKAVSDPDSITAGERDRLIDLYDGEIRYNDARIGELLDQLRDRGRLTNSLVIVTADHGDAFGERGYYEHPRYLHSEITHVPLIVRVPHETSGKKVSIPTSTLDIAATILDFADASGHVEGNSLLTDLDADRTVYQQARGEDDESNLRRYAARGVDGACFCEYHFESGDIEITECAGTTLRSELRNYVRRRLQQNHPEEQSETVDRNEEIQRRLEALGYKE